MYRRRFITCLATSAMVLAAGCSTTGRQEPESPEERRSTIDANTQAALARLADEIPGSREFVNDARGILVFPAIISAGLVVGGSYGEGELIVGGEPIDYYDMTAGSVGLLAGAESKALFLLFMDDASLTKFRESKGWTVGADASVSMLDVGATANVSSRTIQRTIVGYALTNQGLMASISLDGSKVSKLDFD